MESGDVEHEMDGLGTKDVHSVDRLNPQLQIAR
jgi:hypothetical protein